MKLVYIQVITHPVDVGKTSLVIYVAMGQCFKRYSVSAASEARYRGSTSRP